MAWVESHENIGQHPKTYDLATALNVEIPTAVGVIHLLWHFTLKFAWRDGNLDKYRPDLIARSLFWNGDGDDLIAALQKSGWMDGMVVHDWMDYAGKIVNDRLYNEKRRNTASNVVIPRKSPATVPYRTLPNLTKPTTERRFASFWSAYPKKIGKGAAEKSFSKIKPDDDLLASMIHAIKTQSQSDQWKKDGGQFIPNPATWLNQKRWEDDLQPMANGISAEEKKRRMAKRQEELNRIAEIDYERRAKERREVRA